LQHAADRATPGDKISVRPGHYVGFQLTRGGTAESPIWFQAEQGTVIDLATPSDDGINLEGASYVVIEGFETTHCGRAGIRSVINHHVTIRKNRADQNGMWGVFCANSDYVVIEHNITSRAHTEHGIYVSSSTDHAVIRENDIWGNHVNGIHLNSGKGKLVTNALVECNIIRDNGAGGGSGINADGLQKSAIQNNVLYGNHGSGISIYRDTGDTPASQNVVLNNTVVQPGDGRWALNIQNASSASSVYNNIFLHERTSSGSICIAADCFDGLRCNRNIVTNRFTTNRGLTTMSLQKWRETTKQDQESFIASAGELFMNAAAHDYHQLAGSPAVAAGTWYRTPRVDLEGHERPPATPDLGAYQRKTSASTSSGKQPDRDSPQLLSVDPSRRALRPLETIRLRFTEQLRSDTFGAKSLKMIGPNGPVAIQDVESVGPTDYVIHCAPQRAIGDYRLFLGSEIQDLAGNRLIPGGNADLQQKGADDFSIHLNLVDAFRFCFGPQTAPIADGYTRVAETTGYSSFRGYGWLNGNISTVDTTEGSTLTRSLAYGPLAMFRVDVPPGQYDVALSMGNRQYPHDQMAVSLQGDKVDTVDTQAGHFHTATYQVVAADQGIRLELRDLGGSDPNVVINTLVITPVQTSSPQAVSREAKK
jgi:hypothetical protein